MRAYSILPKFSKIPDVFVMTKIVFVMQVLGAITQLSIKCIYLIEGELNFNNEHVNLI